MASVYRVRHLALGSPHALKVLNADLAQDADLRERFLAEGRIQAQLRHPHIVAVTDIATDPVPGLVMELIEGETLEDHVRAKAETLAITEIVQILLPVLDAVGEAHRHGIVHRDLKPSNILLGRGSRGKLRPVVADFGIAKVVSDHLQTGRKATRTGVRVGTLLYMSPEQVRGEANLDARSDIFALGAILYELVTGRVAFDAPSEYDAMKNIVEGRFLPPTRGLGPVDPVLDACIRKALAIRPEERFPDCAAFGKLLAQAGQQNVALPTRPSASMVATQRPEPAVSTPPRRAVLAAAPPPVAKAPLPPPLPPSLPERLDHARDEVNWLRIDDASRQGTRALLLSIGGFCCCPGFAHLAAVLMAADSRRVYRDEGVYGHGRWKADFAFLFGWIGLLGGMLMVLTYWINK
ncbi:MAG: serine/threonine protein kinase [Deltaproteobacteria bacterium]|nr:serine/threonine protein kinase [Deltaproteobacteria bacterium]